LFSYCIRSHSTPNCIRPWSSPPLSHDQAFRWSSSHCNGGNIVSIHKLHLCFQFRKTFATFFSPHQFGVATKGSCEIVIHGIKCTLDLRPNWVVF
jgi:hypothetical protein